MEATKKLNGKVVAKWFSNNAIIVMMLAVSLIVGIMHPNFFSGIHSFPSRRSSDLGRASCRERV